MTVPACPRCDSGQTLKIAESPIKGKFEIYRCETCNYVWRSTEDLANVTKMVDYWRENVNTEMLEH